MMMIVKTKMLKPGSRKVRFGYDEREYSDVFPRSEHIGRVRATGVPGEYSFGIDEVIREGRGGVLKAYSPDVPGERSLMLRALKEDYGIPVENE